MTKCKDFDQKALEIVDLLGVVVKALTTEPQTAGEITKKLAERGFSVRRDAVKRYLDALVGSGEAWLIRKDVTRRGHLVKDAAHYQMSIF